MSFQDHFLELRKRIIFCVIFFLISFCACYFFSREIYEFLLRPFSEILKSHPNRKLIYTSPAEAFATYLKLSFYSSLFFSFPIFAAETYLFLSPALYKKEKKTVLKIFFSCVFLFLLGAFFAYQFILPTTFNFFLSFENSGLESGDLPIQLETRISEYLDLVINLLLGFGVAFELPILLLFFIAIDFLSPADLSRKRRYWIVLIFIISAILTPPDVLSQISLVIPMIFLFEITILICKKFNKKKITSYGYH